MSNPSNERVAAIALVLLVLGGMAAAIMPAKALGETVGEDHAQAAEATLQGRKVFFIADFDDHRVSVIDAETGQPIDLGKGEPGLCVPAHTGMTRPRSLMVSDDILYVVSFDQAVWRYNIETCENMDKGAPFIKGSKLQLPCQRLPAQLQ